LEENSFFSSCQHYDGGFSLNREGRANPLDTALAYPALLADGELEKGEKAISYLVNSQCEDGGFSSFGLSDPDLPATALATRALAMRLFSQAAFALAKNEALSQAYMAAVQKLVALQNPDGGFGEDCSTPYETALALESLSWVPEEEAIMDAALAWLSSHQMPDGSIASDTAATALLLSAARPNISIQNTSLSRNEIPEGAPLGVRITIANRGLSPTGTLNICIYNVCDLNNSLSSLEVSNIPARQTISRDATISTLGMQGNVTILAQPVISDRSIYFTEGASTATFFVTPGYNLSLSTSDLSVSPSEIDCAHTTTISAVVRNTGSRDAQNIEVSFYDGNPQTQGAKLSQVVIPYLDLGKSAPAQLGTIFPSGDHQVYIVLDEQNVIPEVNEDDNQIMLSLKVAKAASVPQLLSPTDGASLANTTPTLSWEHSSGADNITYLLELDKDPSFASPDLISYSDIPQVVTQVDFTLPQPLSEGDWCWRVRASDGVKLSEASQARKLTIDVTSPVVSLVSSPAFISPNGDAAQDNTEISIALSEACLLDLGVADEDGNTVRVLAEGQGLQAGTHAFTWDGKDEIGNVVEGNLTLSAYVMDLAFNSAEASLNIAVDVTAPAVNDLYTSTPVFSPNGDGKFDSVSITFTTSEAGMGHIDLINPNPDVQGEERYVGEAFPEMWLDDGEHTFIWNGSLNGERIIKVESDFQLEIHLIDKAGNPAPPVSAPIKVDMTPPVISFPVTHLIDDPEPKVRITVQADAEEVWVTFNGREIPMQKQSDGSFMVECERPAQAGIYPISMRAIDAAGNSACLGGANLVLPKQSIGSVLTHTSSSDFNNTEINENVDIKTVPGDLALDVNHGEILPNLPVAIERASTFYINGRFYIVGGRVNYIFDPATRTYLPMSTMRQQRNYGDGAALGPDGKIYFFGGMAITGAWSSQVISGSEAYDPATNTWTDIAPLPEPRYLVRACTGRDGLIYIFGGRDINAIQVDTVYIYDSVANRYETITQLPAPRCCHIAVEHEGMFFVGGGHDQQGNFSDFWRFDPQSLTWHRLADIPFISTWASAVCGSYDSIYTFFYDFGVSKVARYRIEDNVWELLPSFSHGYGCSRGAAFGPDGKIYMFGGHYYSSDLGELYKSDKAYVYNPTFFPEGILVSKPIDLRYRSSFWDIGFSAEIPQGTEAYASIRSSDDGLRWSEWSNELPAPGGEINCAPGRYLQYRLRLTTQDAYRTPKIFDISIRYNPGPKAPKLISPYGDVLRNACPVFFWSRYNDESSTENCNCILEIDRSPTFDTLELRHLEGIYAGLSQQTYDVEFSLPPAYALTNGTWYWRVCTSDGKVSGEWSYPFSFRVDTMPPNEISMVSSPNPFSPDGDTIEDQWCLDVETSEGTCSKLRITNEAGVEIREKENLYPFLFFWTKACELPSSNTTPTIAAGPSISGSIYIIKDRLLAVDNSTFTLKELPPPNRFDVYGCAAAVNGQGELYIVWKNTGLAERFDPFTNTWSDIATFPGLSPRLVDFDQQGRLYIFGNNLDRNGIYRYDPANDLWSRIGNMPFSDYASYSVTCAQDGLFYLCGEGLIRCYDSSTNTWSNLEGPKGIKFSNGVVGRDKIAHLYSNSISSPLYGKNFLYDLKKGEIIMITSPHSGYVAVSPGAPGRFYYRSGLKLLVLNTGPESHQVFHTWDGKDASGQVVPDGTYTWTLDMVDVVGQTTTVSGEVSVKTNAGIEVLSVAPNPVS
jgi:N-acetylneuraminic acid mutarotase